MRVGKLQISWKGSEPNATPVNEKPSSEGLGLFTGSETVGFAKSAYLMNHLILNMIRIQGLEITLDEMRKMGLVEDGMKANNDIVHMATWKGLMDVYTGAMKS